MKTFRLLFAVAAATLAVAFVATPAFAAATAPHGPRVLTEQAKIEALIAAVEAQPKAVFIRNGSEHGAKQAAAHLRMKWKRAGKRIRTAEQFIEHLASASSLTGRKYRIRLGDGREMEAGVFFRTELAKLEAGG